MKPRLTKSKKWTALPAEYLKQIETVFSEGFSQQLSGHKLIIEGRIYSEEIVLRVGILEGGRLTQKNFEVSIGYSTKTKDAVDRIHNAIDAVASMMNEHFEDLEKDDFPRSWQEYDFDNQKVYLQYSTINSELEAQADALLGQSIEDLVVEEAETEDALEAADEILPSESDEDVPLEEEEEDLDTQDDEPIQSSSKGPSMFSGKKKDQKLH